MKARSLITLAAMTLIASVIWAAPPTEEETLLVLADQAFRQLHDVYVTLPDQTIERVARSAQQQSPLHPPGEMTGLVRKEYIEEAFLSAGLAGLDEGTWMVFRVTDLSADVVLFTRRDAYGEIDFKVARAVSNAWFLFTSNTPGNGCGGDPDDDFNCVCGQQDCDDGCTGPGSGVWINTGDTTAGGNPIYENEHNVKAERCGDGEEGDGVVIVLSPL